MKMYWYTYEQLALWGKFRPSKGLEAYLYYNPYQSISLQLKARGGLFPYELKRKAKNG